ncbi:MAG: stage III sporulation protein AA [Clostridia bacterium]
MESILAYMPQSIRLCIMQHKNIENINEIRLRANKKCIIISKNAEEITEYTVSIKDILDILIKVSENSIYSIQNEINSGFVTIKGGHRIGICGEVVLEDMEKVKNIKNINGMNIRIAKQVKGASNKVMDCIIRNGAYENTIIVSPPGCGKTTLLRDCIRILSSGVESKNFKGKNVGLIDERGEIASVYRGICGLDVGSRTDVMSNCPKALGIDMLVRSMGIDIIATDEIGSVKDCVAINKAALSGVKLILTMHGDSLLDVTNHSEMNKLINKGLFQNIIILSKENGPGNIKNIYTQKTKGVFDKIDIF